jgi:ABC-2 type transport system ATP-binding protein
MNNHPILRVANLTKTIRGKEIIRNISFEIGEGEVFGFLGPNGSGKTTTIRMLVSLIKPTSGTIEIDGLSLQDNHQEALARIGCIVENPELYPYLTGYENLNLFAGMLDGVDAKRIYEVVETVGLEKRIHDKVKSYSLGMRQRLGIAQALLGHPKLLILDEPTNGLDPQGIKEMRIFIRALAQSGISVFVSSHLLAEIQLMCDRVAIIRKGEVIAVGKVDALIEKAATVTEWIVDQEEKTIQIFSNAQQVEVLECFKMEVESNDNQSEKYVIRTNQQMEQTPLLIQRLIEKHVSVFAVQQKHPTLEDLFLKLTEGEYIG